MSVVDLLKSVFPKPQLPQKRYLLLAAVLVYGGLKLYVNSTVSTDDDNLPDQFVGVVTKVLSHNGDTSVIEVRKAPEDEIDVR